MRIKDMRKNIGIIVGILLFFAGQEAFSANLKELERAELDAMLPQVKSFECLKISDENRLYSKAMELAGSDSREDIDASADCFLMAALKEHADAQYRLALMYYTGSGVPKSISHSYKWATKSRLNENKDADAFIAKLDKEIGIQDLRYALTEVRKTFSAYEDLEKWQESITAKIEFDKISMHTNDLSVYYSEYLTRTLGEIDAIYDGYDPLIDSGDKGRDSLTKDSFMSNLAQQYGKRYQGINMSPYQKRKKLEELRTKDAVSSSASKGRDGNQKKRYSR